jgi:cytochrome c oxidase cbb3-type subunit 2
MRSITTLAAGAGFFFVTLALFVQGVLPALVPESRAREVTRAVRTDLGDVSWVRYPTPEYTALQHAGRAVYIREGCWYCHSQYVRPVAGEDRRWGPVSEPGEYAWDLPHLLSTRRIGPDLSRVGLKYGDDWHYAHHWNPRLTVPDSLMPRFPWLFVDVTAQVRRDGERLALEVTGELRRYFTLRGDRPITLFPDASGLAFVRPHPDGAFPIDGVPVIDLTALRGRPFSASSVRLVIPKADLVALVSYIQLLGTSRGVWRDVFAPQMTTQPDVAIAADAATREHGRAVYTRRCIGCHGRDGDGNGEAATFLSPRPRDFTAAIFKFRSTPSGSLPTDADLFRTVTRGVRGTAMPTWHELPMEDRRAVIAFIKTFSPRWRDEKPEPGGLPASPPPASTALIERGRDVYRSAKCWECHGEHGRGDGPSAAQLRDDFEFPIRPTDFTRGQFKAGATAADIFRALTVGLDGTPMPSFADSLPDEERWAVAYYVLSLSAWTDPLTGQRLNARRRDTE